MLPTSVVIGGAYGPLYFLLGSSTTCAVGSNFVNTYGPQVTQVSGLML